jgi:hypothetical protein
MKIDSFPAKAGRVRRPALENFGGVISIVTLVFYWQDLYLSHVARFACVLACIRDLIKLV